MKGRKKKSDLIDPIILQYAFSLRSTCAIIYFCSTSLRGKYFLRWRTQPSNKWVRLEKGRTVSGYHSICSSLPLLCTHTHMCLNKINFRRVYHNNDKYHRKYVSSDFCCVVFRKKKSKLFYIKINPREVVQWSLSKLTMPLLSAGEYSLSSFIFLFQVLYLCFLILRVYMYVYYYHQYESNEHLFHTLEYQPIRKLERDVYHHIINHHQATGFHAEKHYKE